MPDGVPQGCHLVVASVAGRDTQPKTRRAAKAPEKTLGLPIVALPCPRCYNPPATAVSVCHFCCLSLLLSLLLRLLVFLLLHLLLARELWMLLWPQGVQLRFPLFPPPACLRQRRLLPLYSHSLLDGGSGGVPVASLLSLG